MSRSEAVFGWLEDKSDWLSPMVVKEVRQIVRGQEFAYSFGVSLVASVAVAFFGAADALTGNPTSGTWTFIALIGCLTLFGVVVVPLGAFSALRNERMEQTLELITLTALSPRRVVVGKLLAHGVKLATLFSAIGPFIAMSFLLGGVDFLTILLALSSLFLWSMWAIAACLFLSCLFKSRTMSGLIFGGAGLLLFLFFGLGRVLFFAGGIRFAGGGVSVGGPAQPWVPLAIMATAGLATMMNLVLLAENRLSLATEHRVAPLRIGFLYQFLLIAAWTLAFVDAAPGVRSSAATALGVLGGLHLALVAMFTVTEGLEPPQARRAGTPVSGWAWRRVLFGPGGGRGAIYVLAQMAVLLLAGWQLAPTGFRLRWFVAICAYICFFTGVPTAVIRWLRPRASAFHVRVAIPVLLSLSMVLPDVAYYLLWRPTVANLSFGERHLLNPIRTLASWQVVHLNDWSWAPFTLGLAGLAAYAVLMVMAARIAASPHREPGGSEAAAGEAVDAQALD